jgi:glycosylphosphatidylinositol transamidase (GPIT) subunit GPI8
MMLVTPHCPHVSAAHGVLCNGMTTRDVWGAVAAGESSYSYVTDSVVGLSLIDRFTRATLDFFEGIDITSPAALPQLFSTYR